MGRPYLRGVKWACWTDDYHSKALLIPALVIDSWRTLPDGQIEVNRTMLTNEGINPECVRMVIEEHCCYWERAYVQIPDARN